MTTSLLVSDLPVSLFQRNRLQIGRVRGALGSCETGSRDDLEGHTTLKVAGSLRTTAVHRW